MERLRIALGALLALCISHGAFAQDRNPCGPGSIQIATATQCGLVKPGANLSIQADGTLNATGGGGTPGGSSNQIQVNSAGSFGGISNGTAGQILTSNGSGSPPSFQAGTGGGVSPSTPYFTSGAATSRALQARAAAGPVYNPLDFGALANNTAAASQPISGSYGSTITLAGLAAESINGGTPFSWVTNAYAGLKYTMTSSATAASGATRIFFLETNASGNFCSSVGGWCVTGGLAAWQDPSNGQDVVPIANTYQVLKTGPCASVIQVDTMVTSYDGTLGDANYGSMLFSPGLTGSCASGSAITVQIADGTDGTGAAGTTPDALAGLSQDWLAIDSAMWNAWAASIPYAGGAVAIPCGTYWINFPLMNPSGLSGGGPIDIGGCSENGTYVNVAGSSIAGGPGNALFPTPNWEDPVFIHDLSSFGGGGGSVGSFPATGNGIVFGNISTSHDLNFQAYRASYSIVGDHVILDRVFSHQSACGIEMADFAQTYGGLYVTDADLSNVTYGGLCVAPANVLDSSILRGVSFGFGPFGIVKELTDTNMTGPTGMVTNSLLEYIPVEECGNEAIADKSGSGAGTFSQNTIISGAGWQCGRSPSFAVAGGSNYMIEAPSSSGNTFINTYNDFYASVTLTGAGYISGTAFTATSGTFAIGQTLTGVTGLSARIAPNTVINGGTSPNWTVNNSQTWASSGSPATVYGLAANSGITQAAVEMGGGNHWIDDPGPTAGTAATPFFFCAYTVSGCQGNNFSNATGSGFFGQIQTGIVAGQVLYQLGIDGYYPYLSPGGPYPFVGIAGSACPNGTTTVFLCPIYTQGNGIFALQNLSTDTLTANQAVYGFPSTSGSNTGGISLSANPQSAIGFVSSPTFTNAAGSVGALIRLNQVTPGIYNVGTTGLIGGSLLAAGACASGTATLTGATTGMAVAASPVTYPGDGYSVLVYVSATNTVTVKLCAIVAGTPTASAWNVRLQQ